MSKTLKVVSIILALLTIGLLITGCFGSSEPTGARVGQKAPDFKLQNLDGELVSLSELDKSVLLNFWNTGCPPCVNEMPLLQQIHQERQDEGLMVLTLNAGESAATVRQFMQNYHLSLPVVLDTNVAVAQQYGIQFFPTTFFIDRDGIIQEKVIGGFPTKEAIEKRLDKIIP